jgi:hypothetical protein
MSKIKYQKIWKIDSSVYEYDLSDVKLDLPKIINTDISFQLMFGLPEDGRIEKERIRKHHESWTPTVYKED